MYFLLTFRSQKVDQYGLHLRQAGGWHRCPGEEHPKSITPYPSCNLLLMQHASPHLTDGSSLVAVEETRMGCLGPGMGSERAQASTNLLLSGTPPPPTFRCSINHAALA